MDSVYTSPLLPIDVWRQILPDMERVSVTSAAIVCKSWYAALNNDDVWAGTLNTYWKRNNDFFPKNKQPRTLREEAKKILNQTPRSVLYWNSVEKVSETLLPCLFILFGLP
jgi:hypothetical protein